MIDRDNVYHKATRLLCFGLVPKLVPAQDDDYAHLLNEYHDSQLLAEAVHLVADAMRLHVLHVSEFGIVVAGQEDSVFAITTADYRPGRATGDDRLVDGLIQLAIAACIFPTPADLAEEVQTLRRPVSVKDVEDTLRALGKKLEQESKDRPDPPSSDEERGIEEAWRIYTKRPSVIATKGDRATSRETTQQIRKALDTMVDHGLFRLKDDEYTPTWKYQVLVRELAASSAHQRVIHILGGG